MSDVPALEISEKVRADALKIRSHFVRHGFDVDEFGNAEAFVVIYNESLPALEKELGHYNKSNFVAHTVLNGVTGLTAAFNAYQGDYFAAGFYATLGAAVSVSLEAMLTLGRNAKSRMFMMDVLWDREEPPQETLPTPAP